MKSCRTVLLLVSCVFALALASVQPALAVDFAPGQLFAAGSAPYSVTVGDFNADGKQDQAVTNIGSNHVSVLLGDGVGGFAPAVNYATGSSPWFVTAGNFNADGKFDLAIANFNSNDISVLLGDGVGGFETAVNYTTGSSPTSVTVGDFNADGKSDLAVANYNSNNISVLLGNGSGSFAAAVNYSTGSAPYSVTVGDFNADGKSDLAVANSGSNNVSVLLGDGSGGFAAAVNYATGNYPISVTVGDFNADNISDLAVANDLSNNISVLLGNGVGGFAAAVNYAAGTNPVSVTVGDFNWDNKSDLSVANSNSSNVSVFLGDGIGGFAAAVNYATGIGPRSVTVGDFNSDGKSDLSVANSGSNNISVLLNITPAPLIGVTPTDLSFGSTPRDSTSSARTVTISNSGNASLTVSGISLTGTNNSQFSIAFGTCISRTPTIAVGDSCSLSVTFAPTFVGAKSATLEIASNDPAHPAVAVPLTGTCTPRQFTLSVSHEGNGSGTVHSSTTPPTTDIYCVSGSCGQGFDEDSVVTLIPTPGSDSAFTGWTGSCSGSGPCAVTMTEARSVTAGFKLICDKPDTITVPPTNTSGNIKLTWAPSSTRGVTYVVTENGATIYTGTSTYFTATGRANGSYNYAVKARKDGYADSAFTAIGSTVVTLTCADIALFNVPAVNQTGSYKIMWAPSTAGSTYVLKQNGVTIYSGVLTYYTVSGRTNGSYSYTVQATKAGFVSSAVKGPLSTTVALTCTDIATLTAPAADQTGSYRISWTASVAGSTYILKENGVAIYSGPLTYYTVAGRANGSYSYTVQATKTGFVSSAVKGPVITTVTLTCADIATLTVPATNQTGSYNISWARSTANSTYVLKQNGVAIYTGTSTYYTVTGRTNGSYSYTVQATKAGFASSAVKGPVSTTVTLTCADIATLAVPVINQSGSYRITWTASVAGSTYVLKENGAAIYSGPLTYFTVTARANGSYSYTVQATKAGFASSAVKGPVSTTVTLTCADIATLTAPVTNQTGSYKISWSPGTAGSTYVLKENGVAIYSGTSTYYTVTGRANGSYSYTVQSSKAGFASSAVKGPVSTTVALTCADIATLTAPATNQTGSYKISWTPGTAGSTYVLKQDGVTIYTGTSTYYTVTGRANGSYSYTVQSSKAGFTSSAVKGPVSTTVALTCADIAALTAPATNQTGSYKVSWSSSTAGSTYVLKENGIAVYTGPLTYFTATGRANGSYSYTVQAIRTGYVSSIIKGGATVSVTR